MKHRVSHLLNRRNDYTARDIDRSTVSLGFATHTRAYYASITSRTKLGSSLQATRKLPRMKLPLQIIAGGARLEQARSRARFIRVAPVAARRSLRRVSAPRSRARNCSEDVSLVVRIRTKLQALLPRGREINRRFPEPARVFFCDTFSSR